MSELKKLADVDAKIFKLFNEHRQDYFKLFLEVSKLVSSQNDRVRSQENVKFYGVLRRLINSINNVGCEKRRSEQIDLINKCMDDIISKYDEDLP